MTIPRTRPASLGRTHSRRHSSVSIWRPAYLACLALGTLAVAMSPEVARSHGIGVKSGVVCGYGQVFLCFNGACACYETEEQKKAVKRWKALKRVTNPCGAEPCSPGASRGSSSSAMDRLGGRGVSSAASRGGQTGGGSAARPSGGGTSSAATGGGSSAPNIGTNNIMRPVGSTPAQSQSPGLR
jgi:hypothetical protein